VLAQVCQLCKLYSTKAAPLRIGNIALLFPLAAVRRNNPLLNLGYEVGEMGWGDSEPRVPNPAMGLARRPLSK